MKLRLRISTYGYPGEKFVYVQHRKQVQKKIMGVLPVIAKTGKRLVILTVEYISNLCYIKIISSIVKISNVRLKCINMDESQNQS